MVASRHRKLVAVVAGVLLAGAPVVAVNQGLNTYIERQGYDEVRLAAERAVVRAEWRIDQAIAALGTIAKGDLGACADIEFDAVRRAVMTTTPIKEISVVNAEGAVHCLHLGLPAQTWPLSRDLRTSDDRVLLTVVRPLDLRERALRITFRRPTDTLHLVAYVPADMFLPDASLRSSTSVPEVRLMLNEGTLIAAPGSEYETKTDGNDAILAQRESSRYPLVAVASVSRSARFAEHQDLATIGALGSGVLALLVLAFTVLVPWRVRANPITAMEQAIEAREFVPYYQPVVDITEGKLVGAEVLVRWRKRDGTIISPATFIPLAESSGLIIDITRVLMIAVRDELADVLSRRPRARIGFNLTAQHFADESIVDEVKRIFEGSPIRFSQLIFELTERQALEDLTTARRVIAALQGLGCRVALDDVGTGHGGLSYMLKLGVDYIKIDKMFVDAIGTERYSTTIIETLVELARKLRMQIVAEGVESFDQVTYLRDHGIRLAQGFVFAPPLPGASFLQLLEAVDPAPKDEGALPAVGRFVSARNRVAAA